MKICKACNIEKALQEFYRDSRQRDGRTFRCKTCKNAAAKQERKVSTRPRARQKRYASAHPDRIQAKERRYHEANPGLKKLWNEKYSEQQWSASLKKYGLTKDSYMELANRQDGLCKICSLPEVSKRIRRLSVDHCHKTNLVRGLLCGKCNKAIGLLKDSPELASNAASYLRAGVIV